RHDEQDAIRAEGSGFAYLPRIYHEILAQNGQADGGASGDEEVVSALEVWGVRQYRQACGTAIPIGTRQCGRIEIGPDQSLAGRGLLDLRDQPETGGAGITQCTCESARRLHIVSRTP